VPVIAHVQLTEATAKKAGLKVSATCAPTTFDGPCSIPRSCT